MEIITIKVTNDLARQLLYFLQRRYKTNKSTKLSTLCKVAVFREMSKQAQEEVDEIYIKGQNRRDK